MSTSKEEKEEADRLLVLETVLETAATKSRDVSLKLDAWLIKHGYNTPAAETFIEHLSTAVPRGGGDTDETRFVNLIKTLLPESKWAKMEVTVEFTTKEFMKAFMKDKAEGYGSESFNTAVDALKKDNEEALKNLTGSLYDAPKLVDSIAFERFFKGTCIDFLHTALPVLEAKETNEEGVITPKQNRITPCITAFTKFTGSGAKNALVDCGSLLNDVGEIQSSYVKAKANKVENLPDNLPVLIERQAAVATNAETFFTDLCKQKQYEGDEELAEVADMFKHTVSEPLQAALLLLEPAPPLVVQAPESSKSTFMEKVKQSGPKVTAALRATASAVVDKAGATASAVVDKAGAAASAVVDKASAAASKLKTIVRFFSSLLDGQSVKPVATEQNALPSTTPLVNQALVSETKESTLLAKRTADVVHDEKALKETPPGAEPETPAGPPLTNKLKDAQKSSPSMQDLAEPPPTRPEDLGEPEPVKPPKLLPPKPGQR